MYAVVNRLPITANADWTAICGKVDAFNALIDHPDFRGLSLIRAGENEAIVFVLFATKPALEVISRDVAAPWFAENMRPYLAGPANRTVGEIVAGASQLRSGGARTQTSRPFPRSPPCRSQACFRSPEPRLVDGLMDARRASRAEPGRPLLRNKVSLRIVRWGAQS
jgi:hypothetical protein